MAYTMEAYTLLLALPGVCLCAFEAITFSLILVHLLKVLIFRIPICEFPLVGLDGIV